MPFGTRFMHNLHQAPLILAVVASNLDVFAIANSRVRLHFDNPFNLHPNGDLNKFVVCSPFIHVDYYWTCKNNAPLVSVPPPRLWFWVNKTDIHLEDRCLFRCPIMSSTWQCKGNYYFLLCKPSFPTISPLWLPLKSNFRTCGGISAGWQSISKATENGCCLY